MNIFYNQALKQTQNLRKDLNLFQSFIADNIPSTAIPLQGQITVGLNSLSRTINEYEAISKKEMNMEKQEKAISRVKDFKKQYLELKEKFDNLKIKCTQMEHLNQKNKLLERRSYTNTLPENPYGYIQSNDLNEHDNDKLSRRHFLKATNSQLDDFLGQGQAILNDLIEQRLSIKGIQKKMYNFVNILGLSSNTIKFIERRILRDRILFFGGVIFTLVLFYLIYYWLG